MKITRLTFGAAVFLTPLAVRENEHSFSFCAATTAMNQAVLQRQSDRRAEILAAARTRIQGAMDVQRAEIRKQRDRVQAEIRATIPVLASDIASKVLGREVRS